MDQAMTTARETTVTVTTPYDKVRSPHPLPVAMALMAALAAASNPHGARALREHVAEGGDELARLALRAALKGDVGEECVGVARAALAAHHARGLRVVKAALRAPATLQVCQWDARAWWVTSAVLSALDAALAADPTSRTAAVACVQHAVGVLARNESEAAAAGRVAS